MSYLIRFSLNLPHCVGNNSCKSNKNGSFAQLMPIGYYGSKRCLCAVENLSIPVPETVFSVWEISFRQLITTFQPLKINNQPLKTTLSPDLDNSLPAPLYKVRAISSLMSPQDRKASCEKIQIIV